MRKLRCSLLATTSIFGLALTASAQAMTVSIDQAPTRVAPNESFEVVWTVRTTSAVQQTTVLWGTALGNYPNRGDIRSGPSGTFRTRLKAPANAGTIHWTVYVRTAAARGTTRARTIQVVGAAPTPSFGLDRRVAPSLNIPLGGGPPSDWRSVVAFPNLSFDSPVAITHAPDGSNRLFVVEQDGRVMVFPNQSTTSQAQVFLDIRSRLRAGGEEGLLGLAFAPDYATSRRFYLYYTPRTNPRRTVVARYLASATNPNQALTTEEVLLTISQPYSNHNGGSMAFGPDGMLYVGVGDGGSGGDPMDNGQNRATLLGKILRVDVSGTSLRIPPDNPFVGTAGAKGEIWAYGIRNPWRFSFDRATGDLWVGDIGQNAREEIDIITKGGNYGWPVYEGNIPFRNPSGFPASSFKAPVVDYPASTGRSVIGGYVYRGDRYPAMRGAYFYADYVSDRVWALKRNAAGTGNEWVREIATASSPSSFGEDAAGELYLTSHTDGKIYRLEPRTSGGGGTPFPTRLSQTGVFRNLSTLEASAGLIEYDVNAPLWSDAALKRRWMAIPGLTSKITFRAEAPWTLPTGTVLVKHFELETAPGTRKRLETRLMVNETAGWAGYTYRWNDAGTDADLLTGAASATYQVRDATGSTRSQEWYFPSRVDCMGCHTSAAGYALGLRTQQLNRSHDYPLVRDNQLRAMNNIGLFDTNVSNPAAHKAYPDPHDATKPLADRARAYLAVNCASCHLPGGPTPRQVDLRFETPRGSMHAIDANPLGGDLGISGAKIIKPGSKATSVLWDRMNRRDFRGMPAIGSKVIDDAAVDLIGRWIDGGAQ